MAALNFTLGFRKQQKAKLMTQSRFGRGDDERDIWACWESNIRRPGNSHWLHETANTVNPNFKMTVLEAIPPLPLKMYGFLKLTWSVLRTHGPWICSETHNCYLSGIVNICEMKSSLERGFVVGDSKPEGDVRSEKDNAYVHTGTWSSALDRNYITKCR